MKTLLRTIGAIAMVAAWFIFVPVLACAAAGANRYCAGSVLSTGRWVKIKVRQSGIYQITDRELRDMGFENPEDVAVYGYPAVMLASNRLTDELPDDVPAVPSARYGGKLVFYGEGDVMLSVSDMPWQGGLKPFVDVKRNYFADYGTYFLTDSHPRAVVGEKPYSGLSGSRGVVSVSHGMAHFEEEVQNPGETGARYLGADFLAGGGGEWWMGMPGFNGVGPVNVRLLSGIRLDAPGRMYVRLFDTPRSGHQIAPLSPSFYSYGIEEFGYSLEGVVPRADGIYPVRCQFSGSSRGMAALEYVTALYPRDNTLGGEPQGVFVFCDVARDGNVEFTGEGELPVVWNITRRDAPVALATEKTGEGKFGFTLHASPGGEAAAGRREYVAVFDPAATLLQVECMGEVSCANLHGTPTPEMLVVASREFMSQAERLARLHRDAEGMDVAVVLQDDVYNEFSWGTPHLMAIRRLARMFHDRDAGKFRSILLFGPAHYDSRGLCAGDAEWFRNRYLPMFVCEDARIAGHFNRSYSTDAFVGMLEDDAGPFDIVGKLMTVAVGRIPALSAKEADDYLDKLERYVASPPDVACSTRAALICDAGDDNGHMYDADSLAEVIAGRSPWVTVFKAYNTLYPLEVNSATMLRRRLVSTLKQGVCYLGYNGHGSPTRFGSEELWSVRMAEQTEYTSPPFAMLASCNSLLIDRPVRSTGAAMLFKNRGGAIAVAGSLREVFKADNRVLSLCVGDEFFNDCDALTLGEVFRRARNAVGGRVLATADVNGLWLNTLCYNFAGDPEIRRPRHGHRMELTHANGAALSAHEPLELAAGGMVNVEGCVRAPSGDIDTAFDGYGVVSVFDGRKKRAVVNGNASEKEGWTETDEDLIYEKCVRIEGGRFAGDMYLPVPSRMEGVERVSMCAVSDDGGVSASGWFGGLSVMAGDSDAWLSDETAPEIVSMYLDHTGFSDGDVVGSSPVLYAEVAPCVIGVARMSTQVGKALSLSLDGGKTRYENVGSGFKADEHGGGKFRFSVSGLADGHHTLTLKVTNYAGQSASRTVRFTVVGREGACALSVAEYPAVTEANISVAHTFPSEPSGRIVVADAEGNVVFTDSEAMFPYCWKLTATDGTEVPEGIYEVRAYLRAGNVCGSADPVEVVVFRD